MADVTISELTNRQPNSSAVFPYSEGGTTYNAALSNILPKGLISMWYGSLATIPTGWALCDGTNNTPDLRNRFIVGANVDNAGIANTNITGSNTQTGGSKDAIVVSHSHGITDPGHSHLVSPSYGRNVGGGSNLVILGKNYDPNPIGTTQNQTGITINSEGSSGTNQNLPPFYALAYIMKL